MNRMTPHQKIEIHNYVVAGMKISEIARQMNLSRSTVAGHLRRHPLEYSSTKCKNCGNKLILGSKRKPRTFCSDTCRMSWWNSHLDLVNRKAYYPLVCLFCGKEFLSYGNQKRKYCCRDCYNKARRSLQF